MIVFREGGRALKNGSPVEILLVEDEASDVVFIREFLSAGMKVPYRLSHVDLLSRALECLQREAFDVVLLDLGLPDAQGIDGHVNIAARFPAVPIIVLTGHNDDRCAIEAVQRGA